MYMDDKLIMIVLVFFVIKMLNKKSCDILEILKISHHITFYDTPLMKQKLIAQITNFIQRFFSK